MYPYSIFSWRPSFRLRAVPFYLPWLIVCSGLVVLGLVECGYSWADWPGILWDAIVACLVMLYVTGVLLFIWASAHYLIGTYRSGFVWLKSAIALWLLASLLFYVASPFLVLDGERLSFEENALFNSTETSAEFSGSTVGDVINDVYEFSIDVFSHHPPSSTGPWMTSMNAASTDQGPSNGTRGPIVIGPNGWETSVTFTQVPQYDCAKMVDALPRMVAALNDVYGYQPNEDSSNVRLLVNGHPAHVMSCYGPLLLPRNNTLRFIITAPLADSHKPR